MTIHWTQINGNVFLTKPNPKMLVMGDEIPLRNAKLKGESIYDKRTRNVLFDRAYVVAYLRKKVLEPLNIQTQENLDFLLRLIHEASGIPEESESEIPEQES